MKSIPKNRYIEFDIFFFYLSKMYDKGKKLIKVKRAINIKTNRNKAE